MLHKIGIRENSNLGQYVFALLYQMSQRLLGWIQNNSLIRFREKLIVQIDI